MQIARRITLAVVRRLWKHGLTAYLLLCCSVGLNVLLVVQLNRARDALRPPPFLSGDVAPPLEIRDGNGRVSTIDFRSGTTPMLLYWFSPACSWCEVNLPNVRALAAQAGDRYRLVPVSVSSPAELGAYSDAAEMGVPAFSISREAARVYRFAGTPETLLLSPKGELVKRWVGAYPPSVLDDIENTLAVRLPGFFKAAEGRE